MARLKLPSVLHVARIWRPTAEGVSTQLIALSKSSPPFSYNPLLKMVRSMLATKTSLAEMEVLIRHGVKLELAQKSYLEIAPLLAKYFSEINPIFVHEVSTRSYALSRELRVPFDPPMVYGRGRGTHLPIFIFWKNNPLTEAQKGLLASMIHEMVAQDPDLDLASTSVVDFSAPRGAGERTLAETPLDDLPSISRSDRDEMLSVLVAGYKLALERLQVGARASEEEKVHRGDAGQADLFL